MPRNGELSSQTITVLGPVLSLTAPVVWIFLFAVARPEGLRCAAALRLPYSVLAGKAPVKYTFGRLRKFIRNFTELYKTVLLWPCFYAIVYKRQALFAADGKVYFLKRQPGSA